MNEIAIPKHYGKELVRCLAGSESYGTSVGASDKDYLSVFAANREYVTGINTVEHYKWRSQPEGVKSGEGDIDFTSYELRKFARLCVKGNPSVLHILFADHLEGFDQLDFMFDWRYHLARATYSQNAVGSFLGYMQAQTKRLIEGKGHHVPYRPELVEKYGYDTKYAGHIIRLGFQGVEYLAKGYLTLPLPTVERQMIIDIRNGLLSKEEVLMHASNLEDHIKHVSNIPPKEPDYKAINGILNDLYTISWGGSLEQLSYL